MADERTSNLIKFKPKENSEIVKQRPASECRHYSFEVDEQAGIVECDQCKKSLDPIFVLMRLAGLYRERDYKYDKIIQFEEEQRQRAAKQRQRWADKQAKQG